jgi:alpha-D-ribose 1-methylphosphonate 5-triphosphate synthase subunit PhnL
MSVSKTVLRVENLTKGFRLHALGKDLVGCRDVSFSVGEGEFVGITGRSGSGKSTVLKVIYRTYLPQEGRLTYASELWGEVDLGSLDDRQVLALRQRELGYISQFLGVIPRTTARQVLEHSVLDRGGSAEEAASEAQRMLTHFEIEPALWDSYVNTFSGGEKLRLNIARAMVKRPRLLLLDEPTASLDAHSKDRVRVLLEQLKAQGVTMLGIFHDLEFMGSLCDREYPMAAGRFAG